MSIAPVQCLYVDSDAQGRVESRVVATKDDIVRFTSKKFSLRNMVTLLVASVLAMGSAGTSAQVTTRSFQLGLWTDPAPDADTDIATFWNTGQPAGRSIWIGGPITSLYAVTNIDWSRIVAMEIDEPYASFDEGLSSDSCQGLSDAISASTMQATLAQRATELKALAPKARFWVNLTSNEAVWLQRNNCPAAFNRSYIDVISFDSYDATESEIESRYNTLAASPAKQDQQFALIPGVFSAPSNQLTYLQGYFDLANAKNQSCNLPLGDRGITGVFDGCPVWVVLGWMSNGVILGAPSYVGLLQTGSEQIKAAWESERALPLAPALAHQRTPAQIIQPILQILLE